jgi:hypothetical protein
MDRNTYLALIEPAMQLVVKKHQDYNQGGVSLESYFPFGLESYIQMLHVKHQRLLSLTQQQVNGSPAPQFESIKDTVLDQINYCIFLLQYLEKQPK